MKEQLFIFELQRILNADWTTKKIDYETIVITVNASDEDTAREQLHRFGINSFSSDCKLLK